MGTGRCFPGGTFGRQGEANHQSAGENEKVAQPRFRAAKPKPEAYNDANEFVFEEEEGGACNFAEKGLVKIYSKATNDPKGMSKRPWRVLVKAEWDIAQAKFVSQKITPEK